MMYSPSKRSSTPKKDRGIFRTVSGRCQGRTAGPCRRGALPRGLQAARALPSQDISSVHMVLPRPDGKSEGRLQPAVRSFLLSSPQRILEGIGPAQAPRSDRRHKHAYLCRGPGHDTRLCTGSHTGSENTLAEIFRMSKNPDEAFGDPARYPYMSVCTTGTHDTSTLRQWWEEDRRSSSDFWHRMLHGNGEAPRTCETWICEKISACTPHHRPMLTILPLQDWLSAGWRCQG